MSDAVLKVLEGILKIGIISLAIALVFIISTGVVEGQYGDPQLIVSTNRYAVLYRDENSGQNTPPPDSAADESQTIRIYALKLDDLGKPESGVDINFTIKSPAGGSWSQIATTGANGVASVSFQLFGNITIWADPDEGAWTVTAKQVTDPSIYDTTMFIYAMMDCHNSPIKASGSCSWGTKTALSPYTYGITHDQLRHADATGAGDPDSFCTDCHRYYGRPTGAASNNDYVYPYGYHDQKATCKDCHGTGISIVMKSCYECHPTNNTHPSSVNTLSGSGTRYSDTYPTASGNPLENHTYCILCHGPMHNITTPYPTGRGNNFTEDDHCAPCHDGYSKHNATVNCTTCHSQDIHVIKYLQDDGTTYLNATIPNVKATAVNCTTCHQSNNADATLSPLVAPKVPTSTNFDFNHSEDESAGQKWGSYWDNTSTTDLPACLYCHENTTHNATALGKVTNVQGTNVVNQSIDAGDWCANCHYAGATNYSGTSYSPVPPEITNISLTSTDGTKFVDHTDFGKTDVDCGDVRCHGELLVGGNMTEFMHNVAEGMFGPDCIACHDVGKPAQKVNVSAMNQSGISIHADLNSAANATVNPNNKMCWGCHQSDGQQPPAKQHPDKVKNPYTCWECHNDTGKPYANVSNALNVTEHFLSGEEIRAATSAADDDASCIACHNKTEMMLDYTSDPGGPKSDYAAISHYGKKRADLVVVGGTNCTYCHQNASTAFPFVDPNNKSIYEHTLNATNITGRSCVNSSCHNVGRIHNYTLAKPSTSAWTSSKQDYCAPCHRPNDPNATKYVYAHNTSETVTDDDCGYCHNVSSQGVVGSILKLHTSTLTNESTETTTCVGCHNGTTTYVKISRLILTHFPGAPSGRANTSLDNYGCRDCHNMTASDNMHAANLTTTHWGCNDCHNSSGSGKLATQTPYIDVLRHDNTTLNGTNVNCALCHNNTNAPQPFHLTSYPRGTVDAPGWTGWVNGTQVNCTSCHVDHAFETPFYAQPLWHQKTYGTALDDCYYCHTNVTSSTDSYASVAMHNVTKEIDWSDCTRCHAYGKGGAPIVDNGTLLASGMHQNLSGAIYDPAPVEIFNETTALTNETTLASPVGTFEVYDVTLTYENTTADSREFTLKIEGTNVAPTAVLDGVSTKTHTWTLSNITDSGITLDTSNIINMSVNTSVGGYWAVSVDQRVTNINLACKACHGGGEVGGSAKHRDATPKYCHDCHIYGNLSAPIVTDHIPKGLNVSTDVFTGIKSPAYGYCSVCHNSSLGSYTDPTPGTRNATTSHYGTNVSLMTPSVNSTNCRWCHYDEYGNTSWGVPGDPKVTVPYYHKASTTNDDCYLCHVVPVAMPLTFHVPELIEGESGGPNCTKCHDIGGGIQDVNVTAMNRTDAIHKYLNEDATASAGNESNKRCWACHGEDDDSDGIANETEQPVDDHPSNYKEPYRCVDCHITQRFNAYLVTEHFSDADEIKTDQSYTGNEACLVCHRDVREMMIPPSQINDPDGPGAVYGGANGGNNSTSHYGKKRTDLSALVNTDDYCNYCHSNASTAFDFVDANNKEISEHTANVTADIKNATTLSCNRSDCHNIGRIHNETLTIPSVSAWTSGKQDRCSPCHLPTDTGSSLNVSNEWHNTTTGKITDCTYCHNADVLAIGNAYQNIHSDNLTKGGNASFDDCYECHQDSSLVFTSKTILEHTNASADVSATYLTCDNSSCHKGNRVHSSALVKPSTSMWTLGGNDYCAPCHKPGDANATKYVHSHDPINFTVITGCGYCHNASTQGGLPTSFRLHDTELTNASTELGSKTCTGCHNGTSTYVSQMILTHLPGAPSGRANTSLDNYECEDCHNLSVGASMHSQGLNVTHWDCNSCHNGTAPDGRKAWNTTMINITRHDSATLTGMIDTHLCIWCHNNTNAPQPFHFTSYPRGTVDAPGWTGWV
ncbi:MAG: hypothetical protein QMC85_03485, partial [Methanocellales archaeon]|nr:hypothetical protein [Methanocellales archaeon]